MHGPVHCCTHLHHRRHNVHCLPALQSGSDNGEYQFLINAACCINKGYSVCLMSHFTNLFVFIYTSMTVLIIFKMCF